MFEEYSFMPYIFMAWLGSIAYILIAKLGWEDKAEISRRMSLALIVGFLTWISGLPNHITSFGLGYFAIDAVEAIVNKVKLKKEGET